MKQSFCQYGVAARRRSRRGARKVTDVPKLVLRALSTKVALRSDERGQTMAEYAVILTAITVGILAALLAFSTAIQTAYETVNTTVSQILN
jgi:Flp pilus assembly pilin Flp